MRTDRSKNAIARDQAWETGLSLIVAVLMAAASLAGLLNPRVLYPTEALRNAFVPNDVVNLFLGLPTLLGSAWLARRGRLVGLLLWPGTLFYVFYNYIAYAVAMPGAGGAVAYTALVVLSAYTIFRLIAGMDREGVRQHLEGAVPRKFPGGVLAGLGGLFFLRAVGQGVQALTGHAPLAAPDLGVLVADLCITSVWIVGGISLWRHRALGYASGAGLLFQASMLFVGLLAFFILQPFLTSAPFPLTDFVVILVMGLICFVPFALFLRGILRRQ